MAKWNDDVFEQIEALQNRILLSELKFVLTDSL